ncbi:hypothetical protein NM208_g4102 [Fusarium decemcellulare]|uniref:Uncharacterized protein n=1 Tax=Fusarium decemcellulare TaxID=57161 RepID=A0ACC1SM77_9HYPO|nr:hypothetical protein NM208_g4102 [Fusarium decemcellulare]
MSKTAVEKLLRVLESLSSSLASTKVGYRNLGNCGLRVSNLILGGLHMGSSKWLPLVLDEAQALPLLKVAYDRGINTWDTANVYSNGQSERIMAKAMSKFGIPRSKVILMTKCYRVICDPEHYDPGAEVTMHNDLADQSKDYVNQWGKWLPKSQRLSRAAIFNAVEASLERLNTHYIDVFHIHRFDNTVPIEETVCALNDLVRAGMVRYIGASSMWTYQLAAMQNLAEHKDWTKFVSMQNHYNLIYREEEREMIKYCNATGWAPLASGRLARSPSRSSSSVRASTSSNGSIYAGGDDSTCRILARVEEVAKKRGWPISYVGLAWLTEG